MERGFKDISCPSTLTRLRERPAAAVRVTTTTNAATETFTSIGSERNLSAETGTEGPPRREVGLGSGATESPTPTCLAVVVTPVRRGATPFFFDGCYSLAAIGLLRLFSEGSMHLTVIRPSATSSPSWRAAMVPKDAT